VIKPRPVYLNLTQIRLPLPGFVSILHRISGAALFLLGIPLAQLSRLLLTDRAIAARLDLSLKALA
jgi:succinate dehydrogenase / fumarate reductase cytochrome b subunit